MTPTQRREFLEYLQTQGPSHAADFLEISQTMSDDEWSEIQHKLQTELVDALYKGLETYLLTKNRHAGLSLIIH